MLLAFNDSLVCFLKYIFSSLDLLIIGFLKALVTYCERFALNNFFFNGVCMFKTLKNVSSNNLHVFICVMDKIFCRFSLKDSELKMSIFGC